MATDVTELTPTVPKGDIEVWLTTTGRELDGHTATMTHPTEEAARAFITNSGSQEWQRCVAITMVRIPRALLKERWTRGG